MIAAVLIGIGFGNVFLCTFVALGSTVGRGWKICSAFIGGRFIGIMTLGVFISLFGWYVDLDSKGMLLIFAVMSLVFGALVLLWPRGMARLRLLRHCEVGGCESCEKNDGSDPVQQVSVEHEPSNPNRTGSGTRESRTEATAATTKKTASHDCASCSSAGACSRKSSISKKLPTIIDRDKAGRIGGKAERIKGKTGRIEGKAGRIEDKAERIVSKTERIEGKAERIEGKTGIIVSKAERIEGKTGIIEDNMAGKGNAPDDRSAKYQGLGTAYIALLGVVRGATPCLKILLLAPLILTLPFHESVIIVGLFAISSSIYSVIGILAGSILGMTVTERRAPQLTRAGAMIMVGIGTYYLYKYWTYSCPGGI